jgi:dTDP-4-dehydrorhamnose reductase
MAGAGLACRVEDIPSSEYTTRARRPMNSRLDCRAFAAAFGVQRPDWQAGLRDILRDLDAA